MLPALRSAVRDFLRGFASDPIALDLKSYSGGNVGFTPDAIALDWYNRNGYSQIYSAMGGGMSAWSGESVTLASALNHSVVAACNRLISEAVGGVPLVMLQQKGNAKRVADEHPAYACLHDMPSVEMTAMNFRSTLTSHCLLQGNAYAKITRRSGSGTAIEFHPLLPAQVTPDREKNGQKRLVYVVKTSGEQDKSYTVERGKPQDLFHMPGLGWDGLVGYSVIHQARQSIGTAIATERHVGAFYGSGGRVPYVLEMAKSFKGEEDFKKFRADWEQIYSQPHKAPILENDLKYKQIGLNAVDSQMLETRLFNIHEICRWFLVSPHLVGDLSRATFSNIEQLALEFDKVTLSTWINRWEQELRRCVLTDKERAEGYYFKHNLNSLLRGDFLSRMTGYSTMLQNGIASIDEVRDLEDWNPAPDGAGEALHIQLNQQTLGPNGTTLPPQDAAVVALGAKELPLPAPAPTIHVTSPPVTVHVANGNGKKTQTVQRDKTGRITGIETKEEHGTHT